MKYTMKIIHAAIDLIESEDFGFPFVPRDKNHFSIPQQTEIFLGKTEGEGLSRWMGLGC